MTQTPKRGRLILRNRYLIRLAWRIGRWLYMRARAEQRSGSIAENGERFLQQRIISSVEATPLVVLDIGANRGEWTVSLLNATPMEWQQPGRLEIHAFEPVPATAEMFRAAVEKTSRAASVTLHKCALSSEPGRGEIAVYEAGAGTNTLHFQSEGRPLETRVEIELKTLAGFCAAEGIDRIHLAKCDTEGHDAWVLKGAAALLEAGRIDVFQFEYNHRWVFGRAFLKDVFDLIDELPYTVARVERDRLALFQTWHPELERFFQSNYVLIHDRALAWFPLRRGEFDQANTYA